MSLANLARPCDKLEEALGRMMKLPPQGGGGRRLLVDSTNKQEMIGKTGDTTEQEGSDAESLGLAPMGGELNLAEQGVAGPDPRYNHSWHPDGPKLGWFWIPKGRLILDCCHPAQPYEVRRYGYDARKIRVIPPPHRLQHSFAQAAMAKEPPRYTKKRQEKWMEDDDLLGEELKEDLRHQLNRGGRGGAGAGREISKERRVKNMGGGRSAQEERGNYGGPKQYNTGREGFGRGSYRQEGWADQRPGGVNPRAQSSGRAPKRGKQR